MRAKFGCGPTVVSKNRGVQTHTHRQTDKGTLQLYSRLYEMQLFTIDNLTFLLKDYKYDR